MKGSMSWAHEIFLKGLGAGWCNHAVLSLKFRFGHLGSEIERSSSVWHMFSSFISVPCTTSEKIVWTFPSQTHQCLRQNQSTCLLPNNTLYQVGRISIGHWTKHFQMKPSFCKLLAFEAFTSYKCPEKLFLEMKISSVLVSPMTGEVWLVMRPLPRPTISASCSTLPTVLIVQCKLT
jgi:hypothetical protein